MARGCADVDPEGLVAAVSYDDLHALLDEEGDDAPPDLNDDERWLLRHMGAAAALLLDHAQLYRDLLDRRRREQGSDVLRANALDAAATLAVFLQSARRRTRVLIAASETWMSSTLPLGALDQLFCSFILLSDPVTDDRSDAILTQSELEELMEHPELQAWLERIGALGAGGEPRRARAPKRLMGRWPG